MFAQDPATTPATPPSNHPPPISPDQPSLRLRALLIKAGLHLNPKHAPIARSLTELLETGQDVDLHAKLDEHGVIWVTKAHRAEGPWITEIQSEHSPRLTVDVALTRIRPTWAKRMQNGDILVSVRVDKRPNGDTTSWLSTETYGIGDTFWHAVAQALNLDPITWQHVSA